MHPSPPYTRVETLQAGLPYYLRQRLTLTPVLHFRRVYFVAYTTCPAVVIVTDTPSLDSPTGRFPCDRLDLFDLSD
jgi:hypothetical protein